MPDISLLQNRERLDLLTPFKSITQQHMQVEKGNIQARRLRNIVMNSFYAYGFVLDHHAVLFE